MRRQNGGKEYRYSNLQDKKSAEADFLLVSLELAAGITTFASC